MHQADGLRSVLAGYWSIGGSSVQTSRNNYSIFCNQQHSKSCSIIHSSFPLQQIVVRSRAVNIMNTFIYRGGGPDVVPRDSTHVIIHESVTVIPEEVFRWHPNIVEVSCHAGVEIISMDAFYRCPRLKRVVMPGVEDIWSWAFHGCKVMTHIECDNLRFIEESAFDECTSLVSINLQSAKVIERYAFDSCSTMTEAIFGKNLKSVREGAFVECRALERVVIPLKNGLMTHDDIFQGCENLKRVDLVEAEVLREMVATLHLEKWRDDMTEEIESINRTLPDADPGSCNECEVGQKAIVIREWMARTLMKIIDYKAQHRHLMNEATTVLQLAAPNDFVVENVIPFLELPVHTFDGEDSSIRSHQTIS